MIRLYATFNGLKDLEPKKSDNFVGDLQMMWSGVRNDAGEDMSGEYHSNRAKIFDTITLRKGNRYVIECKKLEGSKLIHPVSIRNTNKNPRCGVIRKVSDDYTFITGKFKGKWLSKLTLLELDEMKRYLLWLGSKTNNEATVINVLNILKKINNEK